MGTDARACDAEENNDVYMIDKVNSRNKNALKINNNKNSRKEKSKSEISINYAFSRDNKNISEGKYINIKNQSDIYKYSKNSKNIKDLFSYKNNLNSNKGQSRKKEKEKNISPSTKSFK